MVDTTLTIEENSRLVTNSPVEYNQFQLTYFG